MRTFPITNLHYMTERFDLEGPGGNAYAILGSVKGWFRDLGLDGADEFMEEATSGDYEHLLATVDKWFGTLLVPSYHYLLDSADY